MFNYTIIIRSKNSSVGKDDIRRRRRFAIEYWILNIEPKVTDRVDAVDEVGASE